MRGYYFITDDSLSRRGNAADVQSAVEAGVSIVQYRKKSAVSRALYREALELKEICSGTGTRFIVNDRLDIALAVDADGVHLGQEDLPCEAARRLMGRDRLVGVTVRNTEQAMLAEASGADYVGAGPVFQTTTKADAPAPKGISLIREIRASVSIPVVAVAGITLDNVNEVIAAGADMVCAVAAVIASDNVLYSILQFQRKFDL